jgi:hypothetical protein
MVLRIPSSQVPSWSANVTMTLKPCAAATLIVWSKIDQSMPAPVGFASHCPNQARITFTSGPISVSAWSRPDPVPRVYQ